MSSLAKTLVVVLFALTLCTGCQERVISEKSFSSQQFKEYEHLPRAKDEEPRGESVFSKMGHGITNGGKSIWNGIKGLNPFD